VQDRPALLSGKERSHRFALRIESRFEMGMLFQRGAGSLAIGFIAH
jgi:hypothetical protein